MPGELSDADSGELGKDKDQRYSGGEEMTREEAIDYLKDPIGKGLEAHEEAVELAVESLKAWDRVIKFVSDRIEHWDAPCSGDEVVRKELASVIWEIGKQMKEVEK